MLDSSGEGLHLMSVSGEGRPHFGLTSGCACLASSAGLWALCEEVEA